VATVRILHASDLHMSVHKNMVSPVDQFSHLRSQANLNLLTLSNLAREAYKAFRKKMTASSYEPVVLKRLAHFIYHNSKEKLVDGKVVTEDSPEKIDAVILSGDLATTGHLDDIKKVKNFFTAPFDSRYPYESQMHEATVSAVRTPIWYFPGNHDRLQGNLDWVWITYAPFPLNHRPFPKFFDPGGTNFDSELLDFNNEAARVLGEIRAQISSHVALRVVVLAADFSLKGFGDHEGFYGWLAQGRVYDRILRQLVEKTKLERERTEQSDDQALCLLWAIHFPPSFPHISSTNRLLLEQELVQKATEHGVRAVLAGHTHEQVRYRKPTMNFDVFCCGTTTQYVPLNSGDANRFQIIVIDANDTDDIVLSVENYRYKRAGEDGISIAHFYRES